MGEPFWFWVSGFLIGSGFGIVVTGLTIYLLSRKLERAVGNERGGSHG